MKLREGLTVDRAGDRPGLRRVSMPLWPKTIIIAALLAALTTAA